MDQIVAAEDHRPAQILAQDVPAVDRIEVPFEEPRRHRFDSPRVVGGHAGLRERLFVDVGGVDLDALPEVVDPHRLGQQHRQRVGLLPGRAPGAPDPDRVAGAALRQHGRDDLVTDVIPRLRVPEEARHVDQDRVEQGGELVCAGLQSVEVLLEGAEAGLLHAVAHAAHQGGPLVAGEVESARVTQETEQIFEGLGLVVGFAHTSPCCT